MQIGTGVDCGVCVRFSEDRLTNPDVIINCVAIAAFDRAPGEWVVCMLKPAYIVVWIWEMGIRVLKMSLSFCTFIVHTKPHNSNERTIHSRLPAKHW